MASDFIQDLQNVDRFSLQLDHWTSYDGKNVLMASISHIDKEWKQQNQVIEFKQLDNTRALTTSEELKRSLLANKLDNKNCIAFQSDNCNALIAAHRLFISCDLQSLPDEDFIGSPLNIPYVGCGAHIGFSDRHTVFPTTHFVKNSPDLC